VLADYVVSYACTNTRVGGQTPSGSGITFFDITPAAGDDLTCTFTNHPRATLRLRKTLPGGRAVAGNQFRLEIREGSTVLAGTTTTGTSITPTEVATLSSAIAGTTYNLREVAAGSPQTVLADYVVSYACTNTRVGGQTPSGSGSTFFDLTPIAGDDLTCTIENALRGSITLVKDAVPDTAQDFAFTTTGAGLSSFSLDDDADVTLPSTRTFSNLAPGSYSVTETAQAGWVLTGLTCTDPDSGSTVNVDGRVATLDLDAGENITCTYTNTQQQADLRVQKTATPDPVLSGDVVTYTIAVTNAGPAAANGTVLTDSPGAGLNCSTPSTTVACTATGGAACPAATVPVSTLTGSGMTIPTLPAGGQVTVTLQCTVTVTGFP